MIRIEKGGWERVNDTTLYWDHYDKCIDVRLNLFVKSNEGEKTFIAFSFPFSYKECRQQIIYVENKFENDKDIYFNRQTLIYSPEGRNIDLITISSYDSIKIEEETILN